MWNDRDLVPGEQWEAGITDALHRADIVLLFYTTAAQIGAVREPSPARLTAGCLDAGVAQ